MTIGERIKSLRKEQNMTQAELANKVGTTKQNIYKYENGIITNIPSDRLQAISNALNVSPAVFFDSADDREKIEQITLTTCEETLLSNYRQLNSEGQKKVNDYTEDLVKGGLYSNDDDDDDEGEEYLIAARTFGKNKDNAIRTIRLKKRKGAGSIFDQPDYKEKL